MGAVAKSLEEALRAETQDPALKELLQLAKDNSISSRNQLVERLGDLYFQSSPSNSAERDLMAEILRDLVRDVEMAVRSKLARKLAVDPNASGELITMLAHFGAPQHVTIEELSVETFYPANDVTRQKLEELAAVEPGA